MSKRRNHTSEFKASVLPEVVRDYKTINEIASEYKIHPNMVTKWKKLLIERRPDVLEHGMKKGFIYCRRNVKGPGSGLAI